MKEVLLDLPINSTKTILLERVKSLGNFDDLRSAFVAFEATS